jgi:hypothetical protein
LDEDVRWCPEANSAVRLPTAHPDWLFPIRSPELKVDRASVERNHTITDLLKLRSGKRPSVKYLENLELHTQIIRRRVIWYNALQILAESVDKYREIPFLITLSR